MKRALLVAWVFTLSFSVGDSADLAAGQAQSPQRYIVVFEDGIEADRVPEVANEMARLHGLGLEHHYSHSLKGFSATIPAQRVNAVRNDPRVNSVTEDKPVQAFCHALSEPAAIPTGVKRVNADLSPTADIDGDNSGVNAEIAVLDTGVYKHYDLNVTSGVNCTKSGCPSVTPADKNGHGTHVAGTAAAKDNNRGVVGVAPGARIRSVKVLGDTGWGWTSWIIAGIDYVTKNAANIDVANMSLGGSGSDTPNCGVNGSTVVDPFHKAICNSVAKGIVYVVAAGNEDMDATGSTPAAYPEVIAVSAIADSDGLPRGLGAATSYGPDDTLASFSNFGSAVTIAAPGVSIYSTAPGDKKAPQGYCATMSGTSMASPHVAGAAALYVAANRASKTMRAAWVESVKTGLLSFATPQNSPDGFTGDPDSSPEPLLNVGGL